MPNPMTLRMAQALAERKPIALLAAIDHPDGMFRAWTGVGELEFDGETWTGVGILGSISPVKRTSDLEIQELQFRLSGVPPNAATWLSSDVRNRDASAWLACLDQKGQVIADPYPLIVSLMDYQTFAIDESAAPSITIIAQTGFYTLERAVDEVWSTEDQQSVYAADIGLDQMAILVNQTVNWTRT